jgi:glycosyltransferase involved in cell wall biosynthesis
MEQPKVTVIVPTYNRFRYLMNTINSIKGQTHKNMEIIVINDGSTQPEYYSYDFANAGVIVLHLEDSSRKQLGSGCAAYARNKGLAIATGQYIAFCDDDDIWFPDKIAIQLNAMRETGCKMSSTEALAGQGVYDPSKTYTTFNNRVGLEQLPRIWNRDLLRMYNFMICSSVIVDKEVVDKIGQMKLIRFEEDYDYWLRALEHTNSVYISDNCVYYDGLHGDGINY